MKILLFVTLFISQFAFSMEKIDLVAGNWYSIKSNNNTDLSYDKESRNFKLNYASFKNRFQAIKKSDNQFLFQLADGEYLSASDDGTVTIRENPWGWETFTVEVAPNQKYYLRSFHGNYLRINYQYHLLDLSPVRGEWEAIEFIEEANEQDEKAAFREANFDEKMPIIIEYIEEENKQDEKVAFKEADFDEKMPIIIEFIEEENEQDEKVAFKEADFDEKMPIIDDAVNIAYDDFEIQILRAKVESLANEASVVLLKKEIHALKNVFIDTENYPAIRDLEEINYFVLGCASFFWDRFPMLLNRNLEPFEKPVVVVQSNDAQLIYRTIELSEAQELQENDVGLTFYRDLTLEAVISLILKHGSYEEAKTAILEVCTDPLSLDLIDDSYIFDEGQSISKESLDLLTKGNNVQNPITNKIVLANTLVKNNYLDGFLNLLQKI